MLQKHPEKRVSDMNQRKKPNTITPLLLIMAAVMFAMAIVSLWWNHYVFLVELLVSLGALAAVIVGIVNIKQYLLHVSSEALRSLGEDAKNRIQTIPVPAAILGEEQEIIAVNQAFLTKIAGKASPLGDPIDLYLSAGSPEGLYADFGMDTFVNGNWYITFAVKGKNSSLVYFVDDNKYKVNSDEYILSRPSVALIAFDNKEELERDAEDGEASRISVLVERAIAKWVSSTTGFYKKISGGRYLVIFEERFTQVFVDEKFKILEEIRAIEINDRMSPTISIGIGRGGENLKECEQWAKQALDMALGRGGDQVAVKRGENYQFFGGLSKGVEKRDKVRTRVIAGTLTSHVSNSSTVFIMGHRYSDLDSVGACIGMWSGISKGLHHSAYIVIDRQQTLAKSLVRSFEEAGFESIFKTEDEALDLIDDHSLLIIVDTHSPNFLDAKAVYDKCRRVVVIDHHRMMVNHIDNALVFYHEPYASSACEMTAELVQYLGDCQISRLESEALLSGIMLDTKNFVLRTGVRTFEAAAFLRSKGADTVEVKRLFSNSIDTYKVKYKLVSEAEIFNYCAIACTDSISTPDLRIASAQAADELLGIENVKASFVMYKTGKTTNISARSLGDLNVQVIMEALGGGGHQTMAACQLENTSIEEARERLLSIINELEINKKAEAGKAAG